MASLWAMARAGFACYISEFFESDIRKEGSLEKHVRHLVGVFTGSNPPDGMDTATMVFAHN